MVLLHSGVPGQYTVGAGYRLALAVREAGRPGAPRPRLRLVLFHGKRHPAGAVAAGVTRGLPRPPERRTGRHAPPDRPDARVAARRAASAGTCAKIRRTISQPIEAWPRLSDRSQVVECMEPDRLKTPRWAVAIGRPALQGLPECADRPIPSPNCSSARRREGDAMVRGVRFLVDDTGRRTAVQIDLKKQARLWEDFYDRALAEQRASEPREPLKTVKNRILGRRRRRG